jgi:hypothetical protein
LCCIRESPAANTYTSGYFASFFLKIKCRIAVLFSVRLLRLLGSKLKA